MAAPVRAAGIAAMFLQVFGVVDVAGRVESIDDN
jgi:hypothetical protein